MEESRDISSFEKDYDLFLSCVQITKEKELLRRLARRLRIRTLDYYCNVKYK